MNKLPERLKFVYTVKGKIIIAVITGIIAVIVYFVKSRIDINKERKLNQIDVPQINQRPPKILFRAVINDPDGYTNVRNEPSKQSPVINQLYKGQVFDVLEAENKWYKIECPNKVIGYVFYDRVQRVN